MKTLLSCLVSAIALSGCASSPNPATERGKNVVKLERKGWSIVDAFANALTNIAVNTATNLATEQLGGGRRDDGFRK